MLSVPYSNEQMLTLQISYCVVGQLWIHFGSLRTTERPSYLLQNSCQVSWRRRRLYVKLLDQCRLNPPVWFSARRLTQSGPVDSECESTATKGYQRLPEGATTLCVVLIATHMSMISGQAKPIPVEK